MKSEDILIALGNIDDKLISNALPAKTATIKQNFMKIATAVAACVCVVLVVFFAYSSINQPPEELPKLNASINLGDGMGFAASRYYDLKYSSDINPWTKNTQISTLPVYRNLCYNEKTLSQNFFSEKQVKQKLRKTARALGEEIISFETQWSEEYSGYFYNCVAETENFTISETGTSTGIRIKNEQLLLKSKNIDSFFELYPELLDYKNYETGTKKAFSNDNELLFEQTVAYRKNIDLIESIINYNLSSVNFTSVAGDVSIVIEHRLSGAEKIGDYPIVSLAEAEKRLLSDKFVTSVPISYLKNSKISKDAIEKAELVYVISPYSSLYIPYYLFYVYLENTGTRQTADYGHFYVPAIEEDYIENYELWNGMIQ